MGVGMVPSSSLTRTSFITLTVIAVVFLPLGDCTNARKLLVDGGTATTAAAAAAAAARSDSSNGEKYGKVLGYVVCDACREKSLTANSVFLGGMTVSLTCQAAAGQPPFFAAQQQTDSQGRFSFDVPAQISFSPNASKLCSTKVSGGGGGGAAACSASSSQAPDASSLSPYAAIQGHPIFTTGPFVYTPSQSMESKSCSRDSTPHSSSEKSFGDDKAPALPSIPGFPPISFPPVSFPTFGGIPFPSSPASQFPITSLFPPIPTNAPPLIPGLPPFSGFPQLPAFQFPFFAAPPPPGN